MYHQNCLFQHKNKELWCVLPWNFSLIRDLAGYRSVRAVGQRYRIIYEFDYGRQEVWVVTLGIRKEGDKTDVYKIASRLKE